MATNRADLEIEIAALTEAEQARIAADIFARLHHAEPAIEAEWADEALRRYRDARDGVETFGSDEVIKSARRRLRQLR